ncbi:MAG: ATP-binding protein, partial [Kiritimatiellia bacterium]
VHLCKVDIPLIIESNWTLLKDESGTPKSILTINSDITDKKDLENQFLRAQRMESIGTLAGGIAHDLNNMLAPILMAIELLTDIVTDPQGLTLLNSMQDSAMRGAELVKQVLSFARGVEGERIAINPNHLIRELITVLRETFPKSITITFKAGPDGWVITGDPTQVHQVLLNMCVNARDAMPDGGDLRIRMQNKILDESITATNINARAGSYVLFRISDTGTGMSQKVLDKIFEPFFTTKCFGKGTGLGLSTTLAIVRSHKGFIDVTSEEGKGTTFDIYFPAETRDRPCNMKDSAPHPLPNGNGEWILAVEDEEAIRKVLKHTLERFNYHVILAENGKDAVQVYAEHQGKITVVLTDMAMPVMDGPGAILAIRKLNPDARIIMSSGLTTSADITDDVREMVTAFIPKPYAAEALLHTLHNVLHPGNPDNSIS